MRRVVDNLLSNAIKFTPDGKCIVIETRAHSDKVLFQVNDEGIGIPEQALHSLFKEFSKNIRRPGIRGEKSTGLGLSIVKQIVEMHKGKILVESQENHGTKFTIEFSKNGISS
ncbi:sensor histidine kinase [uncultured Imperialibacter sp.]|uniref:sensor histidine kinase n=1 Tax=Imperialibacter sp. TaxID=2038411 RepID=UPI0030D8FF1B